MKHGFAVQLLCEVGHDNQLIGKINCDIIRYNRKEPMRILSSILVLVLCLTITQIGHAQSEEESDTDLAKETQNPLADLISVPFQNNIDFNVGPNDRTRYTLNIQPVIPFQLAENWNLITRTILPVIYQPNVLSNSGGNTGLGDLNFTAWLSPRKAGRFLWGVGGTLVMPTATEDTTGTDKWSAGHLWSGVYARSMGCGGFS